MRVKLARRPGGIRTAKAEMDDIATAADGRKGRAAARDAAEAAALGGQTNKTKKPRKTDDS